MSMNFRYVENEGALFRISGPSNAFPDEVWSPRERKFFAYEGAVPKPVGWGSDLSDDEVRDYIGEEAMQQPFKRQTAR